MQKCQKKKCQYTTETYCYSNVSESFVLVGRLTMTKVDLWKSFIQEQNNNASMTKGQSSLQVAAKGKQE